MLEGYIHIFDREKLWKASWRSAVVCATRFIPFSHGILPGSNWSDNFVGFPIGNMTFDIKNTHLQLQLVLLHCQRYSVSMDNQYKNELRLSNEMLLCPSLGYKTIAKQYDIQDNSRWRSFFWLPSFSRPIQGYISSERKGIKSHGSNP